MKTKRKKRTKKKQLKNNRFNKDIIGIIVVGIAIISGIGLFTNKVGIVGSLIRSFTFSTMGFGGYFFPLLLLSLGISIILDKFNKEEIKPILIIAIIFIIFIIFLDSKNASIDGFSNRIKASLSLAAFNKGGGLVGSFLGYFFYKLFGVVGGYIILFFTTLILLLSLFNIKLKDVYEKISMSIKNYKNNLDKSRKNKRKEEKLDQVLEKENTSKNKEIQIQDYNENDAKENLKLKSKSNDSEKEELINQVENNSEIYVIPPLDLLLSPEKKEFKDKKEILKNADIIEETMKNFGISSEVTKINRGPTITCYELSPSPGIKLSKIVSLSDNISLSLASSDIRIEAPIPGKSAVGIEVPNKTKDNVMLKEILTSEDYKSIDSNTPIALGKDVSGNSVVSSIDKMPHLLIAGATGSGKSVCINTIIMSIIYKSSPDDVKLLLIDPKVVELSIYNKIPHLLIPVVTDPKKASFALNWAVEEMEKRYNIFAENNVRDITSYNEKVKSNKIEKMSSIVIIIDELSDLMMVAAQEVEEYICRLAQMARAAGIYLIVATQRPSVDVITGTIKANIPSRISFAVSSQIDSRTILDMGGAEKLLGKGDMLFYPSFFSKPLRIQGAFISDNEVESIVDFLSNNHDKSYNEEVLQMLENSSNIKILDSDELLPEAINLVLEEGQASISLLQRKLRIGYARAARIVDEMEEQGVVGGYEGSKPRKVLISKGDLDSLDL